MHKSLLALAQFETLALVLALALQLPLSPFSLSLSLSAAAALSSCLLHVSFVKKAPGILLSALLNSVLEKGKHWRRATIAHLFRLWYKFGKDFLLSHFSLTDSIIICILNRPDSNCDFAMTDSMRLQIVSFQ